MVFEWENVTLEEMRGVLRAFEGCFRGFCVSDGEFCLCRDRGCRGGLNGVFLGALCPLSFLRF